MKPKKFVYCTYIDFKKICNTQEMIVILSKYETVCKEEFFKILCMEACFRMTHILAIAPPPIYTLFHISRGLGSFLVYYISFLNHFAHVLRITSPLKIKLF